MRNNGTTIWLATLVAAVAIGIAIALVANRLEHRQSVLISDIVYHAHRNESDSRRKLENACIQLKLLDETIKIAHCNESLIQVDTQTDTPTITPTPTPT